MRRYTEQQAAEKGYEVKAGKFPFQPNGKALGLGETAGFVKILVDAKYGEILGAHLIGPEVTELLPEYTLAHSMELTAEEIARNVHAHPTLSEMMHEEYSRRFPSTACAAMRHAPELSEILSNAKILFEIFKD